MRNVLLCSILSVAVVSCSIVCGNNPTPRNYTVNHDDVREECDNLWNTENHTTVSTHSVHPAHIDCSKGGSSSMLVKACSYALGFSALLCGLQCSSTIDPSMGQLVGTSALLGWMTSYFDDHVNYHYVDAHGNDLSSRSKNEQLNNSCRRIEFPEHVHHMSENGERQQTLVSYHSTKANTTPAPILYAKKLARADSE